MYFITGTDTNIGKTFISALLTYKLKATYFKPIQAGDLDIGGDTAFVKNMTQLPEKNFIEPAYALSQPLSPHEAARRDDITIDINNILKTLSNEQHSSMIIEGAGGLMVPLNDKDYVIDLIKKINFPVILVARSSLGTINHTLLSISALEQYNIPIKGIILNGDPHPHNKEAIEEYSGYKVIAEIPYCSDMKDFDIKAYADLIKL